MDKKIAIDLTFIFIVRYFLFQLSVPLKSQCLLNALSVFVVKTYLLRLISFSSASRCSSNALTPIFVAL
jgi:hypothetical protein